jgi:hypothetical protein
MADTRGDIPFYGVNPLNYALTVGTSSVQVLAANPQRKGLVFHNPHATAKIAFCCATNNLGQALPAVMNGAGSMVLVPLGTFRVDPEMRPVSAWNAISDTAGAALTIFEFL